MKSIMTEYPDFRSLPKGVRQMLVASESLFFAEASGAGVTPAGREANRNWWMPPLNKAAGSGEVARATRIP